MQLDDALGDVFVVVQNSNPLLLGVAELDENALHLERLRLRGIGRGYDQPLILRRLDGDQRRDLSRRLVLVP